MPSLHHVQVGSLGASRRKSLSALWPGDSGRRTARLHSMITTMHAYSVSSGARMAHWQETASLELSNALPITYVPQVYTDGSVEGSHDHPAVASVYIFPVPLTSSQRSGVETNCLGSFFPTLPECLLESLYERSQVFALLCIPPELTFLCLAVFAFHCIPD